VLCVCGWESSRMCGVVTVMRHRLCARPIIIIIIITGIFKVA